MDQERSARIVGGRFRLVEQLGSGGFGLVWRAHDELLGVDVAAKEVWLPQRTASEREHRERLVRAAREARNAAKLRGHPHIVAVHDVVVEDGTPWIVMDLVEGGLLVERLNMDGPLPSPRVAEVATALLTALKAAHQAGIVHRDIKPANVLLAAGGRVLLTDFGIAVHETDTKLTVTGGVIGSAEYMAPERLNGIKGHEAGDLFSLGATLYEAVEGVSPFRRDTPTATLAAVALQDHPPLERADPALAGLITSLLAKEPEARPDIEEALAMLRGGARTVTAPAPPAPPHTMSTEPHSPDRGQARFTVCNAPGDQCTLRVLADDVELGTLEEAETGTFTAAPGVRAIRVRKGRYSSELCVVRLIPGAPVRLVARTDGKHLLLGTMVSTTPEPAASHRSPKHVKRLLAGLLLMVIAAWIVIAFSVQIQEWNNQRTKGIPAPGHDGVIGWSVLWAAAAALSVGTAVTLFSWQDKARPRYVVGVGAFLLVFPLLLGIWPSASTSG